MRVAWTGYQVQQSMLSKTFYFGCGLVSIFDGDQKLEGAGNLVMAVIGRLSQNQTVEMVTGRRLRPVTQKRDAARKWGRPWVQYPVISR